MAKKAVVAGKTYQYTIDEICVSLIAINRFYATILSKITKIKAPWMPTAGVAFNKYGKLTLFYNEEFLLSKPLNEAQGVIIHEVLHIFFRHLTRLKTLFLADKDTANIAADTAINQLIDQKLLWKEPEPCMPQQFQIEELEKAADFYYYKLKQKKQEQQKDGKGQGGSGVGKLVIQQGKSKGKEASSMDSHEFWDKVVKDEKTGETQDAAEQGIDAEYESQKTIMNAIKECHDYGKLPDFVKREIEDLQKEEYRYNWKHALRVFVNSVLAVEKRLSAKRVNRRARHLGLLLPGKKKARRPRLLLARDTSGSVFNEDMQNEFLNEMISITKFADVFVVDCDTEIHNEYRVKNKTSFQQYQGGGGTSFVPVFEKAKKLNVDGIVYLTDTYGDFPSQDKAGKYWSKTIWTTIDQEEVKIPFGKHVNIVSK